MTGFYLIGVLPRFLKRIYYHSSKKIFFSIYPDVCRVESMRQDGEIYTVQMPDLLERIQT